MKMIMEYGLVVGLRDHLKARLAEWDTLGFAWILEVPAATTPMTGGCRRIKEYVLFSLHNATCRELKRRRVTIDATISLASIAKGLDSVRTTFTAAGA